MNAAPSSCLPRSNEHVLIFVVVVLELLILGDDLFLDLLGILLLGSSFLALALGLFFRLFDLLFLFIVLGFLQADEVLTIDLIQLLLDVVDDLRDAGNEDELERVHTPVRHLERHVERHELSLQGCDRDQNLEELRKLLTGVLDGLATHAQTEKVTVCDLVDVFQFEDWDVHTSNVIILQGHTNGRTDGDMVDNGAAEVARSELSLGHAHASVAVIDAHSHLRLHNFLQNCSESLLQRVGLLFE